MGLLSSKFETYLLDEEMEFDRQDNQEQQQTALDNLKEYPEGFFSEL